MLRPESAHPEPEVIARHWWNPNLEYRWFTLPGMITLITTVIVGYGAIAVLLPFVRKHSLNAFGVYAGIVGIAILLSAVL